jgi:hypothetical protein
MFQGYAFTRGPYGGQRCPQFSASGIVEVAAALDFKDERLDRLPLAKMQACSDVLALLFIR